MKPFKTDFFKTGALKTESLKTRAVKTILTTTALMALTGAANAAVWNVAMNANVVFPGTGSPVQMTGFTGTYDDIANTGFWSGTTTIAAFATTLNYTQTFTMNAATGSGVLNAFDIPTCTDNTGSGCAGLSDAFSGPLLATAPNPTNSETIYQTPVPFIPANGWTGQWTVQINESITDPETGQTTNQYFALPMNVTLSQVPIPAAAWLLGSGLLTLAGTARRRS